MKPFSTPHFFGAILALLAGSMISKSADLTWDNVGADGEWNTTSNNWSGFWTNGNDAIFDASTTAGTVTLTEDITAGNITFDIDGYTLSTATGNLTISNGITANGTATISGANEVILGANNTWETASGKTLTVSSVISGGQALTKSGTGTLKLSGANTYTGTTTINAGTLELSGGSNDTSNFVINGGTLLSNQQYFNTTADIHLESSGIFQTNAALGIGGLSGSGSVVYTRNKPKTISLGNGGETTTFSGSISETGTGALTIQKNGAGTLTLSGNNSYSGTTRVSAGTLVLAGGNAIADGGLVTTANTVGALLQLNDDETIGGLTGGGANGGGVDLQSNTLTIDIADGSDRVFIGNIMGSGGSLTIAGNGTQTLAGTNTYTGTTTVNSGTLRLQNGDAIADTGAVVIADEATATLELVNIETIGSLSGGGTNGGTLDLGVRTLTVGDATNTTFAGNIVGDDANASLTKVGSGNLTLSGTNTYTGTTTVSAGTLILADGNAIADSGVVNTADTLGALLQLNASETIGGLTGGGSTGGSVDLQSNTLTIDISGAATFSGNIVGSGGSLTKAGTGTQTLAGTNTYTGTTTINAGTLQLQNTNAIADTAAVVIADEATATLELLSDETIGSLAGGGSNGGTLDLGGSKLTLGDGSNTTFAGNITGDDSDAQLTKVGSGNLTLSGTNSYTGTTTVNAGTLILAGGNAIDDSGRVDLADAIDALLQLHDDETIGILSGGGTLGGNIDLQGHTLTVTQTGNIEYGGTILGTGELVKNGSNTLTLSGNNTYTGTTTINAGTLDLNGTNQSSNYVVNGGVLNLTQKDDLITNTADVHVEAGASVTFNTNYTIGGLSGNGSVQFSRKANRSLALNNGNETTTFSGVISETNTGALSMQKNGTGTLTLSGNNTHRGATTVTSGTLLINSTTGSGTGTGAVIVNNGATLGGTGRIGAATTGSITIQSGGTHTAATTTTAGSQTLLGDLTYDAGSSVTWNLIDASASAGGDGTWDLFELNGTDLSFGSSIDFMISDDALSGLSDSKDFLVWSGYNSVSGLTFTDGYATNFNISYSGSAAGVGNSNFKIFQDGSNGIFLEFTAVPEPSTCALMGLGLAAFGWHKRRRRRNANANCHERVSS